MPPIAIGRFATVLLLLLLIAQAQGVHCKPLKDQVERTLKPLTPAALAGLVDIGPMELAPGRHFLALSPDHRKVAFQVRQGNPATNSYRLRMVVLDLGKNTRPTVIDEGGDLTLLRVPGLNGAIVDTGLPATIEPQWSPDGRYVYFLKQVDGTSQIWRALATGHNSVPVTRTGHNIDDFASSSDGRSLTYSTTVPDPTVLAGLEEEALSGYRYDGRFVPLVDTAPSAVIRTRVERYEVDLATGRERLLDRLDQSLRNGGFDSTLRAVSLDGRVAWAHGPEGSPDDRAYIKVNESDHTSRLCRATACSGVDVLWWTSDGRRVQFIRREGWAASEMAVYEWQPRRKSPVRLYSTPDLLIDCQPANERLICAREQSTVPRQVILLDPRTGLADILFDPNL